MNLPETITFHGGSATLADVRDLDPFGFTLNGARHVDQNVPVQAQAYDVVVTVVGLSDVGSGSGWVLLLGS
ncbi:hypothetical protein [Polaromonas sp. OV174]|uniref:hypothetical protein n=1 Tax=Polaromonas sp. OV174 TaxID=1855300 RepID=UPI000B841606|nr:hypothetical protein [Polaromonas sp. OV174]